MARSDEFVRHVLDLMTPLGAVRARAMFGGHGIYWGETMFAIVVRDRLYFKSDELDRPEFLTRGLRAFTYAARGKEMSLQYYEAPAEALEVAGEMRGWAQRALRAALRAKAARASRKPRLKASRRKA